MKKILNTFAPVALLAALEIPFVGEAAVTAPGTFRDVIMLIISLVRGLIGILFASLIVGLLFGVVKYMLAYDDSKAREKIRPFLLWGVIGVVVAFGMWGFVGILSSTFGWNSVGIPLLTPPK